MSDQDRQEGKAKKKINGEHGATGMRHVLWISIFFAAAILALFWLIPATTHF